MTPYKIGLLHSLTGAMSTSESPLVDAALMAVEEINATGGVLGRRLEAVIEDGSSDPEIFYLKANELIRQSQITTLFGCWTSASRKAVKSIIEATGAMLWYPVQYEGLESSSQIVYTGSCLNQQVMPAIDWLLQTGKNKFFLLGSDYVFPRSAHKFIRAKVEQAHGLITGDEYVPLERSDFTEIVAMIQEVRPDAIINTLNGVSNHSFYRCYAEAGLNAENIPIMAVSLAEQELQGIEEYVKGHYACWGYFQSLENPENHRFLRNFKRRYGYDRVTSDPIVMAYTQLYLWRQAVETAQSFAVPDVKQALVGQRFESPCGSVELQANQHLSKMAYIGKITTNGQFDTVWQSSAPIQPLPWLGLEQSTLPNKQLLIELLGDVSEDIHANWFQRQNGLKQHNKQLTKEVAERKEAEASLIDSEARFRSIFQSATVGMIVVIDENGSIVEWNPGAEQAFGYSANEAVDKPLTMLMPERYREAHSKGFAQAAEQGWLSHSGVTHEFSGLRKNGQEFPLELTLGSWKRDGKLYFSALVLDITKRKEADGALQRNLLDQEIIASILRLSLQPIELTEILRQCLVLVLQRHGLGLSPKGCIFLVDESTGELVMKVRQGLPDSIVDSCSRLPFGQCMCGLAAEQGAVVFADHIDERHEITYPGILPHGHYCMPIQSKGEVLGVLNMYVPEGHKRTHVEEQFLMVIADTLAGVILRKRDEEELKQAATVFENAVEGIIVSDSMANVITVNQAFTEITGYSRDEVIGQNPRLWKSDHHDRPFFQVMWASLEQTGQWRGEIWNRRKNGEAFPCWQTIRAVPDDSGAIKRYVSFLSDITAIKESQAQIEHLAHHDPLTNLPNRLLFNARLEHALERAHREKCMVGVMFLDLDNFKPINDGLGHPVGDKVLQSVAERLTAQVREEDMVARIAGDEFAIIMEMKCNSHGAAHVAAKILSAFEAPFQVDGQELHLTTSIGISLYPEDGKNVTVLVKNADAAMYRAKEQGKNRYCFYTFDLTEAALERLQLENDLRVALKRNELRVFYQPQYSLATGQLVGAEALVRWQHPDMGLVSPTKFIPLAESTGLIVSIGGWVLYKACAQTKAWQDAGLDFGRIGVNVSGQQIQSNDFVETVREVLEETRLEPQCLELEVTESFIMQQADEAISTLEELRGLGVTLAIDDFGTGYSSLSYLKRLPIDKLKIDRTFIKDIPHDSNDEAITRAIIALGKSLQLKIIAEGVETKEQKEFVSLEGCDEVQGFYYSRPAPAQELEDMLRTQYKNL